MSRLSEAAVISAKGSFITFMGSTISLLFGAAGSIIVARLLSPSEYGLFAVSLVPIGLFSMFSDWGVNSALIRFTAKYKAEEKHQNIKRLVWAGFMFKILLGITLSLALFLSADWVATNLINRPETVNLIRIVSLLVLTQSVYNTSLSVLAGLEKMKHRAAVNLSQATIKSFVSPLLVFVGYGVSGAVIGHVLSYAVAAGVGFLLSVSSTREKKNIIVGSWNVGDSLRLMIGFGLPLYFGSLIGGFVGQFRSLLLPWYVSNELIGNFDVASKFVSLIVLVTGSLGITLFPAFSKFNHDVEPEKTRNAFRKSVRYSSMIVLPIVVLVAVLSKPIIYTLYTENYPQSPLFLVLLLLPTFLVGSGSISIGRFLNSQGDTRNNFRIGLVGSVLLLVLSPVLILLGGIEGFIISSFISVLASNLFGIYKLNRKYGVIPDFNHTGRTLLCSAIPATFAYLVSLLLPLPLFSFLAASAVFLFFYLVFAPVTGAVEISDIINLRVIARELRIIYPFARMILGFEEKMLKNILKKKE